MTNEAADVLSAIRDELAGQETSLVGRLSLSDETLSILDGKLHVTVNVHRDPNDHPSMAHCHVLARISDRCGPLDACVVGMHADRGAALADAGRTWVATVAPAVLSLLHARPVMQAAHFDGSEPWGVSGCHGFVGPIGARFFDHAVDLASLGKVPIFDYAAEIAPPGMVHLVKATLETRGQGIWNRSLEIDGHRASHSDGPWNAGVTGTSSGVVTVFALFHYGDNLSFVKAREETDEAIRRYVVAFQAEGSQEKAMEVLRTEGIKAELVHQVVCFLPLAFGRTVFGAMTSFPPDFARVRQDGSVEEGLALMRQPVFARATVLSQEFRTSEFLETFKQITLTSPEVRSLNEALLAGRKRENLQLFPAIIPDLGVSGAVVERALQQLAAHIQQNHPTAKKSKPWWRFW